MSADCPKLPSISLACPIYRGCTTETQEVNRTCIFACVSGYSLENEPINRVSFQFVCQANGTWSGKIRKCVGKLPSFPLSATPHKKCSGGPVNIQLFQLTLYKPTRRDQVVVWVFTGIMLAILKVKIKFMITKFSYPPIPQKQNDPLQMGSRPGL